MTHAGCRHNEKRAMEEIERLTAERDNARTERDLALSLVRSVREGWAEDERLGIARENELRVERDDLRAALEKIASAVPCRLIPMPSDANPHREMCVKHSWCAPCPHGIARKALGWDK